LHAFGNSKKARSWGARAGFGLHVSCRWLFPGWLSWPKLEVLQININYKNGFYLFY